MKYTLSLIIVSLHCILYCTAQDTSRARVLEVYGFVMTDAGYNFNQINSNWFDALRVNRLPTYKNQFGSDGNTFFGVRQSRFGVRGWTQTPIGELKTTFEFDLFGVGPDEGQTTMRIRHAYAEIGRFAVGQTNTPFMDGDVFPNTVEYWGPTGMVFFRNVQLRYAPAMGKNEIFIALERPGASADQGSFHDRVELDSVKGRLAYPDLSVHYKRSGKWGHIQLAGMVRRLEWKDIHTTGGYDISGNVTGWGAHLSAVINLGKMTVFRGSYVHGEGIQNYMNDAPVDVGVENHPNDPAKPFTGKALPVTGIVAWLDHNWNSRFSTSLGYSSTNIENTDAAAGTTAYKMGQYAIVNFTAVPFNNAMVAVELQWGRREGENGFTADITKVHLAFKYNFSQVFYKNRD